MTNTAGGWIGDCTEADGTFTEVTYDCPLDLHSAPLQTGWSEWYLVLMWCFFFTGRGDLPTFVSLVQDWQLFSFYSFSLYFVGAWHGNLTESHRPIVATSTPSWQEWIPPRPRPWPPFKSLWRICWSWPQALLNRCRPSNEVALPSWLRVFLVSFEGYRESKPGRPWKCTRWSLGLEMYAGSACDNWRCTALAVTVLWSLRTNTSLTRLLLLALAWLVASWARHTRNTIVSVFCDEFVWKSGLPCLHCMLLNIQPWSYRTSWGGCAMVVFGALRCPWFLHAELDKWPEILKYFSRSGHCNKVWTLDMENVNYCCCYCRCGPRGRCGRRRRRRRGKSPNMWKLDFCNSPSPPTTNKQPAFIKFSRVKNKTSK